MFDEKGRVIRLLAISRDITAQRETSEQLKWASEHDGLTSLPNRGAFQARLQAATIRAMDAGTSVGLLLIDLDHFKHINDTLGHAAGDHLLAAFGKRLKGIVRAKDFVARLGGDEFAVIVEGSTDRDDLLRTGEAILKRLKDPLTFGGRVLSAGASIGGALFPSDAQCANELFNNADSALYAIKGTGRGGTKMFHQHMREQAQRTASQLSLARVAISADTVEPHYQQKIELSTGRIKGFEALLRWRHPSQGLQQPDTVAEAFKDYELASKIGALMQRRVFSDMREWRNRGLDFGVVAINAAPAEFMRDDFAEQLLARLNEFSIEPSLVEVEVTEHVFFDRASEFVTRALRYLHEAGVSIALDDFGTGYSSLSHLRDFPVDVVKVDQTFIAKMVTDAEIRAIVSAVIELAASLKIDVVAEGIETDEQRKLLVGKRCSLGQGHYYGRAVEATEVPHLLRL
jgi:diguanylate cyclase (GGDEF)-like protein